MKKIIASLAVVATVAGVAGTVVAHPGHDHAKPARPVETSAATGTYFQPAATSTDSRLQPGSDGLQPAVGISAQGGTELNQLPYATLR